MKTADQSLGSIPFLLLALILGLVTVGETFLVCQLDHSSAASYVTPAASSRDEMHPFVRDEACPHDWFGAAVAGSESLALIGCPRQTVDGLFTGAVHLFERGPRGEWHSAHCFMQSELGDGAMFGTTVAAAGDRLLIGVCPHEAQPAAAPVAYAFKRVGNAWHSSPLQMDNHEPYLVHCVSLALDNDTAIVGQLARATQSGRLSGKAGVFRAQPDGSWRRLTTLSEDEDTKPFVNNFGAAVGLSGAHAIVGAPLVDTREGSAGAAYIYQEVDGGHWRRVATLVASDGQRADCFGTSVAISGQTALVGAMAADHTAMNAGAAYVFRQADDGRWRQIATLAPPDSQQWSGFGLAVALDGDLAVIGAPGSNDGAGAIYVFRLSESGATQLARFAPTTATPRSGFGQTVAVAGTSLLVGAPWQDTAIHDNTGAAYACELPQPASFGPSPKHQPRLIIARQ